jgi:hypothetical protein
LEFVLAPKDYRAKRGKEGPSWRLHLGMNTLDGGWAA